MEATLTKHPMQALLQRVLNDCCGLNCCLMECTWRECSIHCDSNLPNTVSVRWYSIAAFITKLVSGYTSLSTYGVTVVSQSSIEKALLW